MIITSDRLTVAILMTRSGAESLQADSALSASPPANWRSSHASGKPLTSLPTSRKTPYSEKNAGYFDFESLNSYAHVSSNCRKCIPEQSR
jgi:hypothetical protein